MRTILRHFAVASLLFVISVMGGAAPAAAAEQPVSWDALSAYATGTGFDVPPPGANRWNCEPSAAHPRPVVLAHGMVGNKNSAWQALAPTLANNGYCVFVLTYGKTWYSGSVGGVADLNGSAKELAAFVDKVRNATGTSTVDLVGYSEGGNLGRLYIKNEGGRTKVHTYVSLAGVNMGPPTMSGLLTMLKHIPGGLEVLRAGGPAFDQLTDPAYFASLNKPAATYPGINYTAIASSTDEVVTPYELALLPAAGNVTNRTIQSLCPDDKVGHLGITYDKTAVAWTLNALDPAHPQDVPCDTGLPL
ncbi:esterase/lipase family protein [Streptomyces sp. NPDC051218]|uniref:esterase/lipase family protein n=1 Tax=Streptomyces sp. NPDC051218 TaxID=3365645 RepID=UPI0037A66D9A